LHRGATPYTATFHLARDQFNNLVGDGAAVFDVTTPQDTYCYVPNAPRYSSSYANLTLSYEVAGERDCNHSGAPDPCDFSSGYSLDLNMNSLPDECDNLGDNDASDKVDLLDLEGLTHCIQGPETDSKACAAYDFNLDGHVDLIDLRGFMMVFDRP
jgi:hypothetical protein